MSDAEHTKGQEHEQVNEPEKSMPSPQEEVLLIFWALTTYEKHPQDMSLLVKLLHKFLIGLIFYVGCGHKEEVWWNYS